MLKRVLTMIVAGGLLFSLAACSTDTELGGVRIPNARPDTRITGQPPTLLEAGFAVDFNWTGSDPDGKITGFEWKISDNGLDGISPRDTLTQDPLTGAILNPWRFTAANDSTFFVLADQEDFPGDPAGDPRSFRTHSLFIRSVDDKGAKDPTPAYISFTSTTIVPTCRAVFPQLNAQGPKIVPPTVNIGWSGIDSDFDLRIPTKVRFLWKKALDPTGAWISTRYAYDRWYDQILSFDDPEWSPWIRYKPLEEDRRVSFPQQTANDYYLFAVQVQDTAGAVSVGFGYQIEVGHVFIKNNYYRPLVDLGEPYLGSSVMNSADYEVAANQPINFKWTATATSYNGQIVSFRHGWDLTNPDDDADPGWAVPPGLSAQNKFDSERRYPQGLHRFWLRVEDDSHQVMLLQRNITVIPYVDPLFQLPLLVIDQVVDNRVQNWPDQSGNPRNDESYRNAYWRFLGDGSGGVADLNWDRDWMDHTRIPKYADLVKYHAVLCYAQYSDTQLMMDQFRPNDSGNDQFCWLAPYQERGGNFFLVGGSSMESFLAPASNYAIPIIFDAREPRLFIGNQEFIAGFGTRTLPDESVVQRGPLMYPYATVGISSLDWTSPQGKFIYGRISTAKDDRNVACAGLKGVVLDPSFKSHHGIGPGVIPDTMYTNPEIDWQDVVSANADTLNLPTQSFPFRNDEFVDANLANRPQPLIAQECNASDAPGGLCIEPMFRGIARFDWLREYNKRQGDAEWPNSTYDSFTLEEICGTQALTSYGTLTRGSAKTNGKVYGYFSYKMVEDKPGQKADVFWGFDPYRFNAEGTKKAIRWVLQYFGLSINQ